MQRTHSQHPAYSFACHRVVIALAAAFLMLASAACDLPLGSGNHSSDQSADDDAEQVAESVQQTLAARTAMAPPTSEPTAQPTSEPFAPPVIETLAPPSEQGKEPVFIPVYCTIIGRDVEIIVPTGTPIFLTWGWEANTDSQIQDFMDNHLTTIQLDGRIIEGEIIPDVTHNQKSGNPEVVWRSNLGVLPRGVYTVTYDIEWKNMIDDGENTYGPGGEIESVHDECQINVR